MTLYTSKLEEEYNFYANILGFEVIAQTHQSFTLKTGWTKLTFAKSVLERKYHYCFLIPANLLNPCLEWLKQRTEAIKIEEDSYIQHFGNWNADSFYFYDGSGNLAEFIVRHDLNYVGEEPFDPSQIICLNEIGMPTKDIEKLNEQLKLKINTDFWKGDYKRFGTNGDQEGLLLLPNYMIKTKWFPTLLEIRPEPFEAIIENKRKTYQLHYENERFVTHLIDI